MPTVYPSQVVRFIYKLFPELEQSLDVRIQKGMRITAGRQAAISSILKMVNQIPFHLMTLEGDAFSDFSLATSELERAVQCWERGIKHEIVNKTGGFYVENPLKVLAVLLSKCPDTGVPQETSSLSFVKDKGFQVSMRLDLAAVNQALANGEWKAATVLGGSILEALLLWSLQEYEKSDQGMSYKTAVSLKDEKVLNRKPVRDLEKWDLHALVKVSEELAIITEETAKACDLVRGYRNLIHPGRAKRMEQVCGRDTALLAVGAVECLIREFERRG